MTDSQRAHDPAGKMPPTVPASHRVPEPKQDFGKMPPTPPASTGAKDANGKMPPI